MYTNIILIWTTTPWTIPGNRAISFSSKINMVVIKSQVAPDGNWAKVGAQYIIAEKLADTVFKSAKVESYEQVCVIDPERLLSAFVLTLWLYGL